jgi:uncharacterized coiled-coil protein SlyX
VAAARRVAAGCSGTAPGGTIPAGARRQYVPMVQAIDIEEAPAHLGPAAARVYIDARAQGLCHEGALELARGIQPRMTNEAARIDTIEIKLAHLERALGELGDVVYRQQQQLDAALAMNQRLREQLEDLGSRGPDATAVEIPPHY